jgi:polar amino acid transport system substrate-binding protein
MTPDKTTMVVFVVCMIAIAVALYARIAIYPNDTRESSAVNHETGSDPYAGGRITIHYHERNPYYITRGNSVGGIIGDRINFIFNQAEIPLAWQKSPARRQLDIIKKNDRREGAAGWFKTPERETFAKFSRAIYQDRPAIALSRADQEMIQSGGTLADTLSNRRLLLLIKDGYSYGPFIDRQLEQFNPRRKVTSADNLGMLKMIDSHRADYFFISEEEAEVLLTHSGLPVPDFKTITFTDMPEGNYRYILFSRRVEAWTIDRLNEVIGHYGIDEPDNGSTAR